MLPHTHCPKRVTCDQRFRNILCCVCLYIQEGLRPTLWTTRGLQEVSSMASDILVRKYITLSLSLVFPSFLFLSLSLYCSTPARALYRHLEWKYEGVPWPSVSMPSTDLPNYMIKRFNEASVSTCVCMCVCVCLCVLCMHVCLSVCLCVCVCMCVCMCV